MVATAADGSEFQNVITAMRDHYMGGAGTDFDLQSHPSIIAFRMANPVHQTRVLVGATGSESGAPDILSDIRANARQGAQTSYDLQNTGAQAAANQVQSDKDADSFTAKMIAQRDKAKADSDANIDKAYAAAVNVGKNLPPDQQNQIFNGMQALMSGLNQIVGAITDVISQILGAIQEIIDALLSVVKLFEPIEDIIALL